MTQYYLYPSNLKKRNIRLNLSIKQPIKLILFISVHIHMMIIRLQITMKEKNYINYAI